MGQVDGKIALITGAAMGIGAACAVRLAEEGATIILTDIDGARNRTVNSVKASAGMRLLHQPIG